MYVDVDSPSREAKVEIEILYGEVEELVFFLDCYTESVDLSLEDEWWDLLPCLLRTIRDWKVPQDSENFERVVEVLEKFNASLEDQIRHLSRV